MAALSAPVVCQAQDPASEFKEIAALEQSGRLADAIARSQKLLAVYGNPNSRIAKQFTYYVPFLLWQNGQLLIKAKKYDEAYEVFNKIYTSPEYKKQNARERARQAVPPAGYDTYLSASLFQMGYCRFLQAQGEEGAPGDPKKYDECIKPLEEYLKLYQSNKVTAQEKRQKMDGKLCFVLLQAYILKPEPDFKKAGEYLEKSRTAKSSLPDDMAMGGLNSVLKVSIAKPEYIAWGHKVLSSNHASFDLGPVRMARYGGTLFNYANQASKLVPQSLKADKVQEATDAARTTIGLLGLVPDTVETMLALKGMYDLTAGEKGSISDFNMGVNYQASNCKSLLENYKKLRSANTTLESYALATSANMALQFGANRLAKGGYQILIDRFPNMTRNTDKGPQSMQKDNYFQFAQICRLTGDDSTASRYEDMVKPEDLEGGGQLALQITKMKRLSEAKAWPEVVEVATEISKSPAIDKTSQNYCVARFAIVAAYHMMGQYDKVASEGSKLLEEGVLEKAKAKASEVRTWDSQTRFFVINAYNKLGVQNPENYDKAMEQFASFIAKYPSAMSLSDMPLLPNAYYTAIDTLLKRRGHGDPQADARDLAKALDYCDVIAKWTESPVYPSSCLLKGNILINGEDEARKPEGIVSLENCVDAALKLPEGKGKSVAANALYWLASYAPDFERENEDAKARAERVKGYISRFWKEADSEGDAYCLQMVTLELNRCSDAAEFDAAVKHAQEIIAREANYAHAHSVLNPDLEKTINSYVETYVEGTKEYKKQTLSFADKSAHIMNFPGIAKDDQYTNAILRMALLSSMNEELVKVRKAGDAKEVARLEQEINDTFTKMRADFSPDVLTNYICVQVGNFAVNYASRVPDAAKRDSELQEATVYFDKVLSRQGEYVNEAKLGKANSLALQGDKAKQQEAVSLYNDIANVPNPDVCGPALFGLTKVHMALGDSKSAIETADKFLRNNSIRANRQDMLMLQGKAYAQGGDVENALLTYTNLYNQNRGAVSYSAPACKAMMELFWERNKKATGDRYKGNFKSSDRWRAWSIGQDYVQKLREGGVDKKMTADDRDKFNEVVNLVNQYGNDPDVQREDKEKKAFEAKVRSSK